MKIPIPLLFLTVLTLSHGLGRKCQINEVFKKCVNTCEPTCDDPYISPCVSSPCKQGCECKPGYVRLGRKCVLEEDCPVPTEPPPPECEENEIFKEYGHDCATCSNYYSARCPITEEAKCYCKDGYVRDASGKCVLKKYCEDSLQCKQNEVFQLQGYDCATCDNYKNAKCRLVRGSGCYCIKGYVRDKTGHCVLPSVCHKYTDPRKCRPNEELDKCANPCQPTCSDPNKEPCPTFTCSKGCRCKPGYVRTDDGKACIPLRQCPKPKCGKREYYSNCGPACPLTCNNWAIYETLDCPLDCTAGCFCKDDFVRDIASGVCISREKCPKPPKCPKNEVYKNFGADCATCDNYWFVKCALQDEPGCYCISGYVRDSEGRCVPTSSCSTVIPPSYEDDVPECGLNESFQEVGTNCHCNRCDTVSGTACYCNDGYVRDDNNICVPQSECKPTTDSCTGENEGTFPSGFECDCKEAKGVNCKQVGKGCNCKQGFIRDVSTKQCVPQDSCPPQCTEPKKDWNDKDCVCTPNGVECTTAPFDCRCSKEFYKDPSSQECVSKTTCTIPACNAAENKEVSVCLVDSCQKVCGEKEDKCTKPPICVPGCACKTGFRLSKDKSKCISDKDCESELCTAENKVYGNDKVCSCDLSSGFTCKAVETPGCYCSPNFYEGANGECLPKSTCPGCQAENESNGKPGLLCECEVLFTAAAPATRASAKCVTIKPDCNCKPGYVRDGVTGKCIEASKCRKEFQCVGENRLYQAEKCTCTEKGVQCTTDDGPECYCAPGFYQDAINGQCYPESKCAIPNCREQNKVVDPCPKSFCPPVCGKPDKVCAQLDNCSPACVCPPGYILSNDENTCIKNEDCEESLCKGNNKEWNNKVCTCNPKSGFDCKSTDKKECNCAEGYFKDENGTCVVKDECKVEMTCPKNLIPTKTICKCVKNSVECVEKRTGEECGCPPSQALDPESGNCITFSECTQCSPGQKLRTVKCTCDKKDGFLCEEVKEGCFCDSDHYIDSEGNCAHKDTCPVPCPGENVHRYDTACVCNPFTGKLNCTKQDKIDCYCNDGFYRDLGGVCVSEEKCQKTQCEEENTDYTRLLCTCNSDGKLDCNNVGEKQCLCKENFYRGENGKCVPKDNCKPKCPDGQVFGTRSCGCDANDGYKCTKTDEAGCYCTDGFYLDSGKCIEQSECNKAPCNEEEVYGNYACACTDNKFQCGNIDISGCYCKSDFFRAPNGTCISKDECKVDCPVNEVFGTTVCECDLVSGTVSCDKTSDVPSCQCRRGFYRDIAGKCVPEETCKPNTCLASNKKYSNKKCSCDIEFGVYKCATVKKEDCYCVEGFYEDDNGNCVPKEACKAACTDKKEYGTLECYCDPVLGYQCNDTKPLGCYCAKGYYKLEDKCVDQSTCKVTDCGPNAVYGNTKFTCNTETGVIEPELVDTIGCYCKSGYDRAPNGKCEPLECEVTCPNKNEKYGTKACQCDPIKGVLCSEESSKRCYCESGYYRAANGNCEKNDKCIICTENEILGTKLCTCDSKNGYQCKEDEKEACYCKDGFYRAPNGLCLPKESCQVNCIGENEVYNNIQCDCHPTKGLVCDITKMGCNCKEGYTRSKDGKCVTIEECKRGNCESKERIYGTNYCTCSETAGYSCQTVTESDCYCPVGFYQTTNGSCAHKNTCKKLCNRGNSEFSTTICTCNNGTYKCDQTEDADCYCVEGFYAAEDGSCEPKSKCGGKTCKPKETYGTTYCTCSAGKYSCGNEGVADCYCSEGYYRDENQNCVEKEKCRATCTKENEDYGTTKCICNPETGSVTCTDNQPPDCYCSAGLFRSDDGKCNEKSECKKTKCTEEHEVFTNFRCECSSENTVSCGNATESSCYCDSKYYRDATGKCTDLSQCQAPCKGDQEYGTTICRCDEVKGFTCSVTTTPVCVCKNGYLENGNCKLQADCSPTQDCKLLNEVFNNFACICTPTGVQCGKTEKTECHCASGFIRADNGQCVSENTCKVTCPKENEHFETSLCECDTQKGSYTCSDNKPKACYCKEGFYRANDGTCVSSNTCTATCAGENEEYSKRECDCKDGKGSCVDIEEAKCNCKKGFFRNEVGVCVENCAPQCPGIELYTSLLCVCDEKDGYKCDKVDKEACRCPQGFFKDKDDCVDQNKCVVKSCPLNEVYGNSYCTCDKTKGKVNCDTKPKSECLCAVGSYRDDNGKCVLDENCKVECTEENEVYSTISCTCNPVTGTVKCLPNTESKCYCKEGFYRAENGKCVENDQCKISICEGDNVVLGTLVCTCNEAGSFSCQNVSEKNCHCSDGFYRASDGTCAAKDTCTVSCRKDEEYGTQVCTCDKNDGYHCKEAEPDCYCKTGFYRALNGKCVSQDTCAANPCDKKNEILGNVACVCDKTLGYYCNRTDSNDCYCKEGYYRATNGQCVDKSTCVVTCPGDNEAYVKKSCLCDGLDGLVKCKDEEKTACYCEDGYYRAQNGQCEKNSKCTKTCQNANEEFSNIFCYCDPKLGAACNEPDSYDCYCKKGFTKQNGVCVACPEPQCKTPLEVYGTTVCTCDKDEGFQCFNNATADCYCQEGYYRAENGKCIPKENCKVIACPAPNEEYAFEVCRCTSDKGFVCNSVKTGDCYCKKGFYRDDNGKCISQAQCLACTGDNEALGQTVCNCNPKKGYICAPSNKTDCYCTDGFYRAANGDCIPKDNCIVNTCPQQNQVYGYKECTCDPVGGFICQKFETPSCHCKPGFYSDGNGGCLPKDKCIRCPGNNKVFGNSLCTCDSRVGVTCETVQDGCYCKPGYYLDNNRECVPRDTCTVPACNDPLKETSKTECYCDERSGYTCIIYKGNGCFCKEGYYADEQNNCKPKGQCVATPCDDPLKVYTHKECTCDTKKGYTCEYQDVVACYCKHGYFNDGAGNCHPRESCDPLQCNGENEVFGTNVCVCDSKAGYKCTTDKINCYCAKGYYRGPNGKCLAQDNCTVTCSGENEIFGTTACKCDSIKGYKCDSNQVADCYCKEGFYRAANGKCVDSNTCPSVSCTKENEENSKSYCICDQKKGYSCTTVTTADCYCKKGYYRAPDGECIEEKTCIVHTCEDPLKKYGLRECTCNTNGGLSCMRNDIPDCYCKYGYYNDGTGKCLPKETCPRCVEPNQVYGNSHCICDRTKGVICDTVEPGCYCKAGYYLDDSNKCVPRDNCEVPSCVGPSKQIQNSECYCDGLFGLTCLRYNSTGCFCNNGTYRDTNGECVQNEICKRPECKDPNKVYGKKECTCDPTSGLSCTLQTEVGCYCKKGFYNDGKGNCIPKNDCTACKGENEVFGNSLCTCDKNKGVTCNTVENGCHCKAGYYKNEKDQCVSRDQCVVAECTDPNKEETASECYCDKDLGYTCIKYANTGCFCKDNLFSNEDGECQPKDQCPAVKCRNPDKAIQFFECYCNNALGKVDCYNFTIPECFCKDGTFRSSSTGECLSNDQCAAPSCGKNEIQMNRGEECVCDPEAPDGITCISISKPGCYCPSTYVRNSVGECVPDSTCTEIYPPCEDPEEILKDSGNECECTGIEGHINCVSINKPGCYCPEGFVRNSNGECVSKDECTPITCSGQNEEYSTCGSDCPIVCDITAVFRSTCTKECKKGCFCKEGYIRDTTTGKCLRKEDCPGALKCTKQNEAPMSSGKECRCDSKLGVQCYPVDKVDCYCFDNFHRDATGQCVPNESCVPSPPCDQPLEIPLTSGTECICDSKDGIKCINIHKAQCYCPPGYIRDDKGACVTNDTCKVQPPVCGELEVSDDCANCEPTCGEDNNECTSCTPGCMCKPDYIRTKGGFCVPIRLCDSCDSENEIYLSYGPGCPKTCDNRIDIITGCNATATSGCFCKDGFIRDTASGNCVPKDECPNDPVCSLPNEEYKNAGNECVCDKKKYTKCIHINKPDCYCKDGFVRDQYGKCMPKDICKNTEPICGENEIREQCPEPCQPVCGEKDKACARYFPCVPSCVCKPGYIRNKSGKCISVDSCEEEHPLVCGPNQVKDNCPSSCQATCGILSGRKCPPVTKCVPGCVCAKGYILNSDGETCITEEECLAQKCGENEEYSICGSACPPTCQNRRPNGVCSFQCIPGCFCKEGTIRDETTNKCVPVDKCLAGTNRCPPREQLGCVNSCQPTCKKPMQKSCNLKSCHVGCVCEHGLVRNEATNECVPKDECTGLTTPTPITDPPPTTEPPKECGFNEMPTDCINLCQATCDYPTKAPCFPIVCKKGCECRPGFIRLKEGGPCVRRNQCNDDWFYKCKANEEIGCQNHCQATCNEPHKKPCYSDICIFACICKHGFVRGRNGECVPKKECHKPTKPPHLCGPNEIFKDYGSNCRTCDNPYSKCPDVFKPGCYCKDGYVRDVNGKCTLIANCEKSCEENEVFQKSGYDCNTCETPDNECPLIKTPDCYCLEGYVRNEDGKCIKVEDCEDKIPECEQNEVYLPSGRDCGTCEHPYKKCPIAGPGCFCKPGYVRNKRKHCVPKDKCVAHQPKCGKNEQFKNAGADCATCDNPHRKCPLIPKPGCYCKDGYVRDESGQCVPKDSCEDHSTPTCDENEVFQLSGKDCATCDKPNADCPRIKRPGCYCLPRFVRDDSGQCVPIDQCTEKHDRCRTNEVFKASGYDCATCQNYKHEKCSLISRPGCFCKEGFVRDRYERCIPMQSCDENVAGQCGPDEVFQQSGYDCATCINFRTDKCPLIKKPGCFCRDGYVRNKRDRCVPIDFCEGDESLERCGLNEVWRRYGYDCATCGNFKYEKCYLKDKPNCYCRDGYVRDRKGHCVPKYMCESEEHEKCGKNEVHKPWGYECAPCKTDSCRKVGKPDCYCKEGYVRNRKGQCVEEEECDLWTRQKCEENEIFKEHGYDCATCENYKNEGCVLQEKPDCYCKEGLVRNSHGQCVTITECEVEHHHKRCGPHEVFKTAGFDCATCNNYQVVRCALQNKPDCYCVTGYVRDNQGRCVSVETCEKKDRNCGLNEVFKQSGYDCATCENHKHIKCKLEIKSQCYCKDGFVRDKHGNCISIASCEDIKEPPKYCDPHEKYMETGKECVCTDNGKEKCYLIDKPACYCEEGYVRNKHERCVRKSECNEEKPKPQPQPLCGLYETYLEGGTDCTCYGHDGIKCNHITKAGCYCTEGFVRNKFGHCVPKEHCEEETSQKCGLYEVFRKSGKDCSCKDANFKHCEEKEKPGCYCLEGFVRNNHGRCVIKEHCNEEKPNQCGLFEVYDESGIECSCSENGDKRCIHLRGPHCSCVDGFVRNKHGRCIPQEFCEEKKPLKCGLYETFKESGMDCSCDKDDKCKPDHRPGCYCVEGFVRSKQGFCVLKEQCPNDRPNDCGLYEVFEDSGVECTCSKHEGKDCHPIKKPGCYCARGFIRNKYGKCIPKEHCEEETSEKCGLYEIFQHSGHECSCKGDKCIHKSEPGCYCVNGFVRDKGRCVLKKDCEREQPKECDLYEVFDDSGIECSCSKDGDQKCEIIKKPGCHCAVGFIRNKFGRCVPKEHCEKEKPQNCGLYESFQNSGEECSCFNYKGEKCRRIHTPGCYCVNGFVRNKHGRCVLEDHCEEEPFEKCGLYEEFKHGGSDCICSSSGEEKCIKLHKPGCYCLEGFVRTKYGRCVPIGHCEEEEHEKCQHPEEYKRYGKECTCSEHGTEKCYSIHKQGCFCKEGYVRDNSGNCIQKHHCKEEHHQKCKLNEDLRDSGVECTCGGDGHMNCKPIYKRGCYCENGFRRNKYGRCIPEEECEYHRPDKCDRYESYQISGIECSCWGSGGEQCQHIYKPGCYCLEGFVRNGDGKCVLHEYCKEEHKEKCDHYEEFKHTGKECTCTKDGDEECTRIHKPGCYCLEGFVRTKSGRCLPSGHCEKEKHEKCELYEEFKHFGKECTCSKHGEETCFNNHKPDCYCIEGFIRNIDGKCVPKQLCNHKHEEKCDENEAFQESGTDCTCSEDGDKICYVINKPGCFCKHGFVRNLHGKCVSKDICDKVDCGLYEVFKITGNNCTCSDDKCDHSKGPGCYCIDGFVRNKYGRCVFKESCKDDEHHKCESNEVFKESGTDCRCKHGEEKCYVFDKPGCFCKDGFLRNKNGKCVQNHECDEKDHHQCRENEEFTHSGEERICTDDGYKHHPIGISGCYCKKDFVRVKGKCMHMEHCEIKHEKCGLYEIYKHEGNNCSCSDVGRCKPTKDSGCYCIEGFVRSKYGRCVPKENCMDEKHDKCEPNEKFMHSGTDCSCRNNGEKCYVFDKPGCFCNEGFLRDKHGKCVPKHECHEEEHHHCQEHEEFLHSGYELICTENGIKKHAIHSPGCYCMGEFVRVGKNCLPKGHCEEKEHHHCEEHEEYSHSGYEHICTKDGIKHHFNHSPGCYCKEEFVRIGRKCLPERHCEEKEHQHCKEHEEFTHFGYELICEGEGLKRQPIQSPGCYCTEGFVRIGKKCIPKRHCEEKEEKCGLYEVYQHEGKNCSCSNINKCRESKEEGCYCIEGFVRSKYGRCVPKEHCTDEWNDKCEENEKFMHSGTDCSCTHGGEKCYVFDKPGCFCKEGFLRGKYGKCVPKHECHEREPGKCGTNEVFKHSGSDCSCVNGGHKCYVFDKPGCFCKEGFLRDKSGKCQPKEECEGHEPHHCEENEEFIHSGDECVCTKDGPVCQLVSKPGCYCRKDFVRIGGKCLPNERCEDKEEKCGLYEIYKEEGINCTCSQWKTCRPTKHAGCYCIDGFLRNKYGRCVPKENCIHEQQEKCENHEVYKGYGTDCICGRYGNEKCYVFDKPGCFCQEGYLRDDNGTCVPRYKCEHRDHKCKWNEEFKKIGLECTCANGDIKCEHIRTVGCYCTRGFIRNKLGRCIPREYCGKNEDHYCIHNEEFIKSGYECTCDKNGPKCHAVSKPGCHCKPGFVRVESGRCVSKDVCFEPEPSHCSRNEIYIQSGVECVCTEHGPKCHIVISPGCHCKKGFVKSRQGICIPLNHCPSTGHKCDQNEYYTNKGVECECSEDGPECHHIKEAGCYCKEDFLRNKFGKCIPKIHCEVKNHTKCDSNEEYVDSGVECTCSEHGPICSHIIKTPGCYCKKDFVRTKYGKCIHKDHCDGHKCDQNEYYTNKGVECECSEDGPKCHHIKEAGCYCKEDFLRNKFGKCIPKIHCEVKDHTKCDLNEEYIESGVECTCSERGPRCNHIIKTPGCYCKKDFVRTKFGKCIHKDHCEEREECDKNEVLTNTGVECRCTDQGVKCNKVTSRGCYCKEGFVKTKSGNCIPKDHCDKDEEKCGTNEYYTESGVECSCLENGPKCYNIHRKGCYCKKGFVRTKSGHCVPKEHCELEACDEKSEEYLECGSACPPTCDDKRDQRRYCTEQCVKGCFCKKGLVRDKSTNKCVHKEECPNHCSAYEEYRRCGCTETCENTHDHHKNCSISNCHAGCFCKHGFVRDVLTNLCIPKENCIKHCGKNEEYNECGCHETCDNWQNHKSCDKHNCVPGCFCKDGLVRHPFTGKCVPKPSCPHHCNRDEEYRKCSCDLTCKNHKEHKKECTEHNCRSGCFCKDGLVRDVHTNKCIHEDRCPDKPECGLYEVISECVSQCEPSCENPHPSCDHTVCHPGCVCQPGYLRFHGHCIPANQCPPPPQKDCGPNEVFKEWGSKCATCDNYKFVKCQPEHKPDCYCVDGYVRNKLGACVSTITCEDEICKKIDANSEYTSCIECNTLCPTKHPFVHSCDSSLCKEAGCRCKPGFYLNWKGYCGTLKNCIFPWKN